MNYRCSRVSLTAAGFAAVVAAVPPGKRLNGADGISDIEGKAARESSERVRATSEFQPAVDDCGL